MLEVRFHGRGGQGAVTAAKILALAAFRQGKYVLSFPFFGTERRGAPVTSFTRIDGGRIFLRSQIYEPDVIVILDPAVIGMTNVSDGIKENGYFIVNTTSSPEEINLPNRVATVDATSIAIRNGLGDRSNPIVNTAILGAFARAISDIPVENIVNAAREITRRYPEKNAESVLEAYKSTRLGWN